MMKLKNQLRLLITLLTLLSLGLSSTAQAAQLPDGNPNTTGPGEPVQARPLQPSSPTYESGVCDSPSLSEDFSAAPEGWSAVVGTWASDGSSYVTSGVDDLPASAVYAQSFTHLKITVSMRRTGDDMAANGVFLRGMPDPLVDSDWHSGYLFEYARNGQFSVWRMDNGVPIALQSWTATGAINQGTSWNTLRVDAVGSDLLYYINGILVWQGVDSNYLSGRIGFRMYKPSTSAGDLLEIDQLDVISTQDGQPLDLFADGFEYPLSGKWTWNSAWHNPQSNNPFGLNPQDGTGNYNAWGEDPAYQSDHVMAMVNGVYVPSPITGRRTYFRFSHQYDFESGSNMNYDGGVLEYSLNNGPWLDAGDMFVENGYNGILTDQTGNTLANRPAFTGSSVLGSSRLDISRLGGLPVRFRFRIGTDNVGDALGWRVDDVRLYTCESNAPHYGFIPIVTHRRELPISSFHDSFANFIVHDWVAHLGTWQPGVQTYSVQGVAGKVVSTSFPQDTYKNFILEARLQRTGSCDSCANRIFLRGAPLPLASNGEWANGYVLEFTNNGSIKALKVVNGVTTILQSTSTAAVINGGWNVVRVVVDKTWISFYINGTLVYQKADLSFTQGRFGFGMYSDNNSDQLDIDWVSVTTLP